MALRNTFGAQSIRQKLLLGTLFLAIIPVAVTSLIIGRESFALPYHVCLSELLYGEPLYRQRRVMWGLPLPGVPAAKPPAADGGAAAPDGGAAGDVASGTRPDAARSDR